MDSKILTSIGSGKDVTVISISGGKVVTQRLNNMGLRVGIKIKVLQARENGPCIVVVDNTRLILGHGMAEKIIVKEV